ncbi:MAG: methyltransferase domain-containing protein [Nitrospirota bacterium]
MMAPGRCDAYNPFAWFYDRHFDFREQALFILERLLFPLLSPGSRILDLCCGTGHLAQTLASRGFRVTGIDGSAAMLAYARQRMPGSEFITADARAFRTSSTFEAVVSMFDSMNHILTAEELGMVFRNVFASLGKRGSFLFDLNMEEAFTTQWHKSSSIVGNDNVCVISGGYDPAEKIGTTRLTLFLLEEQWTRSDVTLYQKCHSPEEVSSALERAGFKEIEQYDAGRELEMPGHLATGRTVFLARK